MSETQLNIIVTDSELANAHGSIPVSMTNDFLFHILMQTNEHTLKSFICSLLHLDPAEVNSVTIINKISLKAEINTKEYFLDVKVDLNGHTIINLELQVINEGNWPERSLSYLSRTFDNLHKSEAYIKVRSAIHIGILNFTLFEDSPEFFCNLYSLASSCLRTLCPAFAGRLLVNGARKTNVCFAAACFSFALIMLQI